MVICCWKRWFAEVAAFVLAGLVAAVAVQPYLHTLGGTPGSSSAFLVPTIRSFTFVEMLAGGLGTASRHLLNLLFLPLNYGLELGFFGIIVLLQFKRYRRRWPNLSRNELACTAMVLVSSLICTFLRSNVIKNNDLGWRGFLIAQFIWVLWSVDYVPVLHRLWRINRRRRLAPRLLRLRTSMAALLILGLAGTAWEAVIARTYLPIIDSGIVPTPAWLGPDRVVGRRTLALRRAYEWLDRNSSQTAIVLQRPGTAPDIYYGNYADRQAVAMDVECGTAFGGTLAACRGIIQPIRALYEHPSAGAPADISTLCRAFNINAIVVKDNDAAWGQHASWVWTQLPEYSNDFARVFSCAAQPVISLARK